MQTEDLSQLMEEQELISQSQLAKVLGVDRSAVSHALKRDSIIQGYNLKKSAIYDEFGQFKGFDKKLLKKFKARKNPVQNDNSEEYTNEPESNSIDTGLLLAGVSQVPLMINSVNQVHENLRLPVLSMLSALLCGGVGYFAGSGSEKGKYAMIGMGIGALIPVLSTLTQKKVGTEDKALLGSNLSADSNARTRPAGSNIDYSQFGFTENVTPLVFAK
jgi:transcriptional regulator with XRE-family HTH domain